MTANLSRRLRSDIRAEEAELLNYTVNTYAATAYKQFVSVIVIAMQSAIIIYQRGQRCWKW